MNDIEVEKNVSFLQKEKLWSISLRTVEPYGKYYPKNIYISAIFHKKLDTALKMAWNEFYKLKQFQDNDDKFHDSKKSEIVKIPV